jgi:FAD/FMN-containing dehydrogenase
VLARRYGLTCDAIEALTVVTADGRVLEADPQCHIATPGTAGTLPRAAFAVKSAYLAKPPPSHGVAATAGARQARLRPRRRLSFHQSIPVAPRGR